MTGEPENQPDVHRVVDHLFRHEAGRLVATLTRLLGLANLDLAEDVVQDTLAQALATWKFGRLPENPTAWLRRAARNRAIDIIRRRRTQLRFEPELTDVLSTEWALVPTVDRAFLDQEIHDSELRLMFSCCHVRLSSDAQVLVILKYLCGFGARELAHAFLASKDAIEKKLVRAKATLRSLGSLPEIHGEARIAGRLEAVCRALYVLFNEGYHGSHPERVVRDDLCREALRLARLLAGHAVTGRPVVHALVALFCLQAARLPGRLDAAGALLPLDEQDRSAWDGELLAQGLGALAASATGTEVSAYHLEAGIAAKHCTAASMDDTDWAGIVELYDRLLVLAPSPIVALNRAVAVSELRGPEAGLAALDELDGAHRLAEYPFYFAARAHMHRRAGRADQAEALFARALQLARSEPERAFLQRRLAECRGQPPQHPARSSRS